MYFKKAHRKEVITLNLVALIDICSILIIFLIMGTVFGESSIYLPKAMQLPQSSNVDQSQSAPQVTIHRGQVLFSIDDFKINLSEFRKGAGSEALLIQRQAIREYLAKLPPDVKKSGYLLNIVADGHTQYKDIFDVVRFYRDSGFQSILFVAAGE